jgi:LysR family glycine cleavage system transcriptional activator
VWPGLKTAHPELEIDLHTSANPVDLLASRYDAVIAVSDGEPRAGLVTWPLLPIATVPVCSPDLLKDGELDFASVPLLHNRPRPDDWRRWLDHAQLATVPVQGGSSFENLGLALEAAAAGLGVALAIESLLAADLRQLNLVRAHPLVRPTRRYFVLEYEQRMADDPAVRAFADWLCDASKAQGARKPTTRRKTTRNVGRTTPER